MSKPRIVKDYDKLAASIQEQIKLAYPLGFTRKLVSFVNAKGQKVSALPFETEEKYYLVRMTVSEAIRIVEMDEDFGDDGVLRSDVREEYADKYDDTGDLEPEINVDPEALDEMADVSG